MEISGTFSTKLEDGKYGTVFISDDHSTIIKIIKPGSFAVDQYWIDIGLNRFNPCRFDSYEMICDLKCYPNCEVSWHLGHLPANGFSCHPIILQEAFFSSIPDDRIIHNKIGKYNGQYCLVSNNAGNSLLDSPKPCKTCNSLEILIWYLYHAIMTCGTIKRHGIVHRDYHLGNFVTNIPNELFNNTIIRDQHDTKTDYIKIIDFGLAQFNNELNQQYEIEELHKIIWLLILRIDEDILFDGPEIFDNFYKFHEKKPTVEKLLEHPIFNDIKKRYNENYDFSINVTYIPHAIILDSWNKNLMNQYFHHMEDEINRNPSNRMSKNCLPLAKEIFLDFISKNGIDDIDIDNILISLGVSLFMAMKITLSIYDDKERKMRVIDRILDSIEYFKIKTSLEQIRIVENNIIKTVDFSKILNNTVSRTI